MKIHRDELTREFLTLAGKHLHLTDQEALQELEEEGMKWLFHSVEIVLENKAYCGASPCTTPAECSRRIAEVSKTLEKFYPLLNTREEEG